MTLFLTMLLAFFAIAPVAAQVQGTPEALGAVSGLVTYADTQQPARLASVVLQPVVDPRAAALLAKPGESQPEGVFHLVATWSPRI